MKSLNNLLLLGDGETWTRSRVDFAGLPEMVRTFLQVAAGAADIPVTRLLGQSTAGLSTTGDSDTRNYSTSSRPGRRSSCARNWSASIGCCSPRLTALRSDVRAHAKLTSAGQRPLAS